MGLGFQGDSSVKKKSFVIFVLISVTFFVIFIFPNNTGAVSENMLSIFEPDEFAQYPYLIHMLKFQGENIRQNLWHFVAYQHYYYGFPFYAFSALTLLPVKLFFGLGNVQLNMLVLRQFVSVLPMILSALFLVLMQSKGKINWKTIFLFIFLMTIPVVIKNNMWWHPDSLAILFCVLTLFFLDRDELDFEENYYFAAIMAGLAIGTKMLGWFFFLTIPVYLFIGIKTKKITWKQFLIRAILFVVLMLTTVFISNPALIHPDERLRYLTIQKAQSKAMGSGWDVAYPKGPMSWVPIISEYYAHPGIWIGLILAVYIGLAKEDSRLRTLLILSWAIPMLVYILFFVAIKPRHLLMPIALPLFSCFWHVIPDWNWFEDGFKNKWAQILVFLILVIQTLFNLNWDLNHYRGVLVREETHPALNLYAQLEREFFACLPDDVHLTAYRDTRAYLPESPLIDVFVSWKTIDYGFIQELNPDLLVLQTQSLQHFLQNHL
jgi:hypothetical protein